MEPLEPKKTGAIELVPKVSIALGVIALVGVVALLDSRGIFDRVAGVQPDAARLVATPAFTSSLEDALTAQGSVACDIEADALGGAATVSVKDTVIRVDRGTGENAIHTIIRGEQAFLWRERDATGRVEYALEPLSFGFGSKYDITRALVENETVCSAFALSNELFVLPVGVVFPGTAAIVNIPEESTSLPSSSEMPLDEPVIVPAQ